MNANRTRTLLLPCAAFAAAVVLVACGRALPQTASAAPQAPPVSVAAALEREVVDSEEFPGQIEAVEQVEVRARVTGYMESVSFKQGAEVKKGDVLFVIDPRPFQAQVERAEAELANSQAQRDLAATELRRVKPLLADHVASRREYDDAASSLRQLEAQTRSAQAALDIARLDLSYTRVTAPITGRVGKPEITAGNLVQGEVPNSPVLTTIVSMDPIYASFDADERVYLKYGVRARNVSQPLPAQVGLADETGFPHQGTLQFVDNRIDAQSGTVRMRVVLDNPDGKLTPGLYARVRLSGSTQARPAVLIAERAIGTDQSKRFVLVVKGDNTAQYREIQPGRAVDAGLRVVEKGLEPGERIVVNGLQRVRPGQQVTPQTVPMQPQSTAAPMQPVAALESTTR